MGMQAVTAARIILRALDHLLLIILGAVRKMRQKQA